MKVSKTHLYDYVNEVTSSLMDECMERHLKIQDAYIKESTYVDEVLRYVKELQESMEVASDDVIKLSQVINMEYALRNASAIHSLYYRPHDYKTLVSSFKEDCKYFRVSGKGADRRLRFHNSMDTLKKHAGTPIELEKERIKFQEDSYKLFDNVSSEVEVIYDTRDKLRGIIKSARSGNKAYSILKLSGMNMTELDKRLMSEDKNSHELINLSDMNINFTVFNKGVNKE